MTTKKFSKVSKCANCGDRIVNTLGSWWHTDHNEEGEFLVHDATVGCKGAEPTRKAKGAEMQKTPHCLDNKKAPSASAPANSDHLPSCGKVASEAEVAAWKVFLKRHREKSPELWPFLSDEIKSLMMDCYLEGRMSCVTKATPPEQPLPIPKPSVKQDDFEAALKELLRHSHEAYETLEFIEGLGKGARWTQDWMHKHVIEEYRQKYVEVAEIRKLWEASRNEGQIAFEKEPSNSHVDRRIHQHHIFERKLKELEG